MALLQNTSNNILFVDNSQEAEAVITMESLKKPVEVHEAKCGEEVANMCEGSAGDQNEGAKGCTAAKSVAYGMSSSQSDVTDSVLLDTTAQNLPHQEANEEIVHELEKAGEDEENEKEKKKGIYDMPLEVEGKRERHKVDRISIATPTAKKHASSVQMGNGVPLGEIAYIEDQLKKHGSDELKTMHRVLYGHPGKATTVKREIRKFTGFAFKEDSQEFKKKVAFLQKLSLDQLKTIKNVLGLHCGGQSKDAVVTTIMVFLMKTVDHARRVAKKRRSSAPKTSASKRFKKTKDEAIPTDDDDEDDGDNNKAYMKTSVRSTDEKKPKKARQSDSQKEVATNPDSGSDYDIKKKKSQKESKDSDADTSSSTSVETVQGMAPSDKDLENVIEELLSQVDLSQVSMKQMCQAVIEKFPGTNLSNRVDYLKNLIKQSLATK